MNNTRFTETRVTLRNAGSIDPLKIEDSLAAGGYSALKKARSMPREEVIDELVAASLRGRGGAGFSAGLKERFTRRAWPESTPAYVICNADEGEPGTFKDRIIMERDPHLLIEGILIAAHAIGAARAYVYIRAEYATAIKRVRHALEQAREHGFVGDAGLPGSVPIEVRLGAGSYLCGEELTLIESLEGKRGYPRIKPPFPSDVGLFGAPTLVNNVETLATIPAIVEHGAAWYTSLGTEDSPGTKIFTISGDVERPGYYEVELGTTLRELIYGFAGGISAGRELQAVLIGGAAGTFVDASVLDTPMCYDALKEKGAILGSGAVIVMAEGRSIQRMTRSILEFFEHESCGKCVPCRVGMTRLVRMMENADSIAELVRESEYMAANSLCPLGQSPILPLRSLARYFEHQFTGSAP